MEEILHQVVDSLSMFIPLFAGVYTSPGGAGFFSINTISDKISEELRL